MAKQALFVFRENKKIKRPGVHAKTKHSGLKLGLNRTHLHIL